MSYNTTNTYDLEPHIAEIYDGSVTYREDVDLLLKLLASLPLPPERERGQRIGVSILEPFCGTGRILIPLVQAGYSLAGLDQSAGMLERLRQKLARLPQDVQGRVSFSQVDVIAGEWPSGFDLVVLGGNCLYELATPDEQEQVIRSAAGALKPGGYIFVDNDHMEGGLSPSWQVPGAQRSFPTGQTADGTRLESTMETIWFDIPARLVKFRRTTWAYPPGAEKAVEKELIQQKHPVSFSEVQGWLERSGLAIEKAFGDWSGNPYIPASGRAIFWARKHIGEAV